ncbi:MAG: polysaccharide biosynthesis protein [Spirochaetes bacterium]|nr:polysaccharide biosynthesis protein [Spirochaetota bacterium]
MGILYNIRGRKLLYPLLDAAIVAASYAVSGALHYYPLGFEGMPPAWHVGMPAAIAAVVFYFFQAYRVMWSYSSISDIYRLLLANAAAFLLLLASVASAGQGYPVPVLTLGFLISTMLSVFYRILVRDYSLRRGSAANGGKAAAPAAGPQKKILVIGAGEAGHIILSEYVKKGLGRLIAGFADDDPEKIGKIMNGKPVICATDGISRAVRERGISEIIIAMPSVGSEKINRIASGIRRDHRSVPIKVLPHAFELDERKPLSISLRDIGIADLIGREEVSVDAGLIEKRFAGSTILVTGAGGSIGSEMCRQLLKFNIKKLVAVGRGEFSMYNLIKILNEDVPFLEGGPEIVYRIADIKDRRLLGTVFAEHRPDIVFHAAAHKHVPLMEFNEAEAMQNNVTGTKNVLDLALEHGTGELVFISTDKAVNPGSIMGATKRIAEILTAHYQKTKGLKTSIVRFGNVIGSRGSVIPLFMEQIERGGPVTVTHPDVTRYFMSIPEASLLVLNAAAYSAGGELFVLDMGKQYRVSEIARRLIEFYGYRSDDEIKIEYTGLRPGEKMHEDLFYGGESLVKTENEKIFILSDRGGLDAAAIDAFMRDELIAIADRRPDEIRRIIKRLVPEFEYDPGRVGPTPNSKLVS